MTGFEPHETFSLLIHAGAKAGKSTLSATAPKPILVLDAEGSWKFIPLRKVYWSPLDGPPPDYDGTWDACVVNVSEWSVVSMVYQYLTQWTLPFTSLVMDSVTEVQRRCRANLKGTEVMKIQDWNVLLIAMDNVIRGFRDLMFMPGTALRCTVFVAETRQNQSTSKWIPYMQGQISISLPYWMDVVGYLYPDYEVDANGQSSTQVRRLLISPDGNNQFEAGERVQGRLGQVVTIPRPGEDKVGTEIEDMMMRIYRKGEPSG